MQGAPATGTGGASGSNRAVCDRLARHGDRLTVAELDAAACIIAHMIGGDGGFTAGLLFRPGMA